MLHRMVESAPRRATYADLAAVPEHLRAQIVDGELVVTPRPGARHAAAASALGEELGPPFKRGRGGPGGWLILFEPELHLGEHVLVPDLAGWHRERLPQVGDEAFFTLVPDWVCEVLSPSTAGLDRVRKLPVYGHAGVHHVWLVDPAARTLEVLERQSEQWLLLAAYEGGLRVRAAPFDAIELDLGVLWADATPAG
jgi:Uma2 family endonuclease